MTIETENQEKQLDLAQACARFYISRLEDMDALGKLENGQTELAVWRARLVLLQLSPGDMNREQIAKMAQEELENPSDTTQHISPYDLYG